MSEEEARPRCKSCGCHAYEREETGAVRWFSRFHAFFCEDCHAGDADQRYDQKRDERLIDQIEKRKGRDT